MYSDKTTSECGYCFSFWVSAKYQSTDGINFTEKQSYVYATYIDDPLVLVKASGERFYYHSNGQFSISKITDEYKNVVEAYAYNAYGDVQVLQSYNSNLDNPYYFTGRQLDQETALFYFRARYYDAKLGQFISRDPIGYVDGFSLYRGYFAVNGWDPSGELWGWGAAAIGALIGGIANAGVQVVSNLTTGQSMSSNLGSAFAEGAVAGGIIGGLASGDVSVYAAAGIAAAAGLTGNVVGQKIRGQDFDVIEAAGATVFGGLAGGAAQKISKVIYKKATQSTLQALKEAEESLATNAKPKGTFGVVEGNKTKYVPVRTREEIKDIVNDIAKRKAAEESHEKAVREAIKKQNNPASESNVVISIVTGGGAGASQAVTNLVLKTKGCGQ